MYKFDCIVVDYPPIRKVSVVGQIFALLLPPVGICRFNINDSISIMLLFFFFWHKVLYDDFVMITFICLTELIAKAWTVPLTMI